MEKTETNDGKKGGLLKGKPHYDKDGNSLGGIKAIVVDSGKPVELEGGEVIINKEASKKYWKELSKINQSAGNGVPILPPNKYDEDPTEYKDGGNIIDFNPNHVPSKRIINYAKSIKQKHPKIWDLGGNIFGNEAFVNLERVSKRGYWLESEEWMYIKWRSYVARHQHDFRIEGVIAMLKWADIVNKGWAYMKDLIEAKIEKTTQMKKGGGVTETYKQQYNEKYNYKPNESHSLEEIHTDTGISIKGLQQIYNKGIGAYKTNPSSVRPNVKSKEQWAMARVYSAVMGGKASEVDANELKMALGGSTSKLNVGQIFEVNRNSENAQKYFDSYYGKGYVVIISDIFNEKVLDDNQFWGSHIKLKVYDSNLKYIFPIRVFFKGKPYGLNLNKKLFSELLSDKTIFPSNNYYLENEVDIKRKINPIWESIIDKFDKVYYSEGTNGYELVSDQVKAEEHKWQFDKYSKYASSLSWADAEKMFKKSLTEDELKSIEISYKKDEYADLEEHDTEKYYVEIFVKLKKYANGGNIDNDILNIIIKNVTIENKFKGKYKQIFDLIDKNVAFYNPHGTIKEELKGNDFYITISPKPEANIVEKISKLKDVVIVKNNYEYANGGKIERYKQEGILELNFYPTSSKHAKEYGINAKNPLFIQNLTVKAIDGLKNLDEYAENNGHDVIFGNIIQTAKSSKDKQKSSFSDVQMIKNGLHNNGYFINQDNNDFHKVLTDKQDSVTMDIPLLIRTLELAREDVKSDAELHHVVENLLKLKNKKVLTMDDYEYIANVKSKHISKMKDGGNVNEASEKPSFETHLNTYFNNNGIKFEHHNAELEIYNQELELNKLLS